jgi:hypothetical protein
MCFLYVWIFFIKNNSEILEVYVEVGDISDADVIIVPLEYNYLMSIDPDIFAILRKQSIDLIYLYGFIQERISVIALKKMTL